jgi:transposase-like protein
MRTTRSQAKIKRAAHTNYANDVGTRTATQILNTGTRTQNNTAVRSTARVLQPAVLWGCVVLTLMAQNSF